jgi:hypothetical protein
MSRRVRLVAVASVVAIVLGIAAYVVWPRGSDLERAARLLPPSTLRVAWTDWQSLREEYDDADDFVATVTDADLASASATVAIAEPLEETFGWSPLESEWEILGQGRDGMVLVLKLDEGTDFGAIRKRYEEAGFTRRDDGILEGGPDVLAESGGPGDPVLQHVGFVEDERLLVTSDEVDYLAAAMPAARGDEDGLDLGDLAGAVDEPLAALAFADDVACEQLAMSAADDGAQARAAQLIAAAGGVAPLTGYLVALEADRRMSVVFLFETEEQAEENLASRRTLAGGEDPAQGVAYPELFRVADGEADGRRVVLRMEDVTTDGYPLTNTTQGAVLLASC